MVIPHLPLLLHTVTSLVSLLLPHLLRLPSILLQSLHTYIHPDHLPSPSPSSSSVRAAIRRPTQDPTQPTAHKSRSRSKPQFDESKAQLFRLRLSGPHLASRARFPSFHASFILSSLSLSNLSLSSLHPSPNLNPLSLLFAFLTLSYLTHLLFSLSLDRSAHNKSIRQSLFLSAALGFLISLLLTSSASANNFLDFDFSLQHNKFAALFVPALSSLLAATLFSPASRASRSFWLGTDQLRWNLSVVSCGSLNRFLLYLSAILTMLTPLLWFNPMATTELLSGAKKHRVWVLFASALLQVVAVRPNVQMYLNEAVLCWYQRLHSSRVPDLDYGRAKVFLHNHYICLVAAQFFGPPVMVMLLIGVSRMRGNLFGGYVLFGACSDAVKGCAMFLAWWIVLVQGVLMMSSLALYRMGLLFVS